MLRFSKMTDYAIVIMIQIARKQGECVNAVCLAEELNLPLPTVSKILKLLQNGDVVKSVRGASGGYLLSKDAKQITTGDIIEAIEGVPNIAGCVAEYNCLMSDSCPLSPSWRKLSSSLHDFLYELSLDILATNAASELKFNFSVERTTN